MKKMMYFGLWERAKTIGLVRKKESTYCAVCIVIEMTAGTYTYYIHVDRSSDIMTLFGKTRQYTEVGH